MGFQEDLEAQSPAAHANTSARRLEFAKGTLEAPLLHTKRGVSARTKFGSLALYFAVNLSLSTFNKQILGKFPFPWILTSLHAAATAVGCFVLLWRGYFRLTQLSRKENILLALFSTLFTINIAISNVSLSMVSMPFHQIMRSTCPVFTVLIYRVIYSQTYSAQTYISLVPMVFGIGMATYGDYYFTVLGFLLTGLGVLLASVKTVATNRLMTGNLKLPPLEILLRMCPLAVMQSLLYAWMTGEVGQFIEQTKLIGLPPVSTLYGLVLNAMLAFTQNISSFQTNKIAGALTMTVCANVKQLMTIVLAVMVFDVKVGFWNGVGMGVTMLGVAWYSKVELQKKGKSISRRKT